MQTNTLSTAIAAGIVATTLGLSAQPADAFLITNTSATWDNVTLSGGDLVGSKGIAASNANQVKFLDVNGQSQVRWGNAVYGGHYENRAETITKEVQVPKTRWVQVPVYNKKGKLKGYEDEKQTYYVTETVTENITKKVWVPPTYENQSGLGYKGVSNLDLAVNEVFNLGQLTHFNQTIYINSLVGEKAEFSLNLDLGDNIGSKKFNFAFSIDETLNNTGNNNNGKACAYQTDAGKGCSDKIAWDFAINEKNTFEYQNEKYSLELVGFGSELAGHSIVNNFISQEGGNNSASLFARLVKVDNTKDIPEPASLLGLAGLGLYFARSRKKRVEEQLA
ncbi:MAG: choice-of-anchor K domain-containing protein [Phormidesmis sp.]